MAHLITIDALKLNAFQVLGFLFGTSLGRVTQFCTSVSTDTAVQAAGLTITAVAFGDSTVVRQSSILETLQILLWAARPPSCATLRLLAKVEADLVCLVQITLQIYIRQSLRQFLLLELCQHQYGEQTVEVKVYNGNDVRVEVIHAERRLKLVISGGRDRFAVNLYGLKTVSIDCRSQTFAQTNLANVVKISSLICLHKLCPSLFGIHFG